MGPGISKMETLRSGSGNLNSGTATDLGRGGGVRSAAFSDENLGVRNESSQNTYLGMPTFVGRSPWPLSVSWWIRFGNE